MYSRARTPPAVPAIASVVDDTGSVQGALASGAASDDTRPTLSGSGATPGDLITVFDNGSAIGSTTVQSDGRWSFTTASPTSPLGEGEHKLTVTATDPVGNQTVRVVSRIWPFDYRQLPFVPIVVLITVAAGLALYVRRPDTGRGRVAQDDDATFEEIGG